MDDNEELAPQEEKIEEGALREEQESNADKQAAEDNENISKEE